MTDKITWTNERCKLGDLKPWPRNPRQIKSDQAKRLADSFASFGQVETIAIGPDGEIYNGHQRLNVLMSENGTDYEVDVRRASRALSEKEREKLTIYLHKGAAGEWDFDVLANEFEFSELVEWGFDEKELLGLDFGEEQKEDPGAQIDRAEELREKWQVETGQLWQIGRHRLICGDCTDRAVVESIYQDDAAAIISDPPYDLSQGGKFDNYTVYEDMTGGEKDRGESIKNFDAGFDPALFLETYSKLASPKTNWFLFCNDYFAWKYYLPFFFEINKVSKMFVWDKPFALSNIRGVGFAKAFELAVYSWNDGHYFEALSGTENYDIWRGTQNQGGGSNLHPTSKPLALIERIVEQLSPKGGVVYDPFLGSGTTLVACERLNRIGRGIEISPAYCAVAIQRLADMGLTPELVG